MNNVAVVGLAETIDRYHQVRRMFLYRRARQRLSDKNIIRCGTLVQLRYENEY